MRELCAAIREQSRLAVHRTGQYRITAGPLLSTTPFLTAHAAQVERTDASDQGQPASEEAADGPAGPRTDAELLAELRAQDLDLSTLTRYRVEKLTGAASRQAQRLLDVLLTAPEQTAQTPEPAPTNGHAVPALAGRAHVHTEES